VITKPIFVNGRIKIKKGATSIKKLIHTRKNTIASAIGRENIERKIAPYPPWDYYFV
jgi:hypothetical protein